MLLIVTRWTFKHTLKFTLFVLNHKLLRHKLQCVDVMVDFLLFSLCLQEHGEHRHREGSGFCLRNHPAFTFLPRPGEVPHPEVNWAQLQNDPSVIHVVTLRRGERVDRRRSYCLSGSDFVRGILTSSLKSYSTCLQWKKKWVCVFVYSWSWNALCLWHVGSGSKDSCTVPGLRMSCLSCVLWRSWRRAEGILRLCSRWCSTDWCCARVCSTLIRRGGGAWQGECMAAAAALLCPACNASQCNATAVVTVWVVEFSQTRRPAGNLMCWTSRTTPCCAWQPVKPLNRASVSSSSFGGRLGVMWALTPTFCVMQGGGELAGEEQV